MKEIYLGAAYYPELWDESEVEKDIARCKELGVNCLRVGEFAWGRMEPEEGKYDFAWLVRVVDKLHENGIATVMCTPTCTPPRWMLNKYPEMRRIMPDLIRSDVSSRCHVCNRRLSRAKRTERSLPKWQRRFREQRALSAGRSTTSCSRTATAVSARNARRDSVRI